VFELVNNNTFEDAGARDKGTDCVTGSVHDCCRAAHAAAS
jgi:hypothetical protein